MLAPDQTVTELSLPSLDVRALARRAAVPALVAGVAVAAVLIAGGRVHTVSDALHRMLALSPGWLAVAIVFECVSLTGYVSLLSVVASRATHRIGVRESAQITFAGAAATRLLPTAGAGGAALTVWALRRAGLNSVAAARVLLSFFVLLYSIFLAAIAAAGTVLALGLAGAHGPLALSVLPAVGAILAIASALVLAARSPMTSATAPGKLAKVRSGARLVGGAVRDAVRLLRSRDLRVVGAAVYWLFDAAVLWAMLHAFGSPPALAVVTLAYFLGQVANTLPLPGTVSGGIAGVLIAFGVPAGLALPAVLAYRTVSVWLPTPPAIAAIPGLRATVTRWGREDAAATPAEPQAPADQPHELQLEAA
ncbi:MAG TPA: lysylphosphatidylglycerol synthase transmembrane domain-containing protein [Solirubrobacteraceae bacterium]